ncbi:MAG TPA: hypothetical protein VE222_11635 [Nitrospiraceae bacterium]|nr:hypothetical protein [Nitrospiraceae bacterium]
MIRVLAISAVVLFSIMLVVGETMAQERSVLQEGFSGTGTGKIGSGPGGGIDNSYMYELLSKPETVYGRLWGKDIPGGKIYVETGGGSLVTLRVGPRTNMENVKSIDMGNDVEVQAERHFRKLGTGAFAAEVPEGDAFILDMSVIRQAVTPTQLVPQAGYQPDTDRGINATSSSTLGGVGGQCWNCYPTDSGYGTDYEKKK